MENYDFNCDFSRGEAVYKTQKPSGEKLALMQVGTDFELQIKKQIQDAFPHAYICHDMYFLTGYYDEELQLYQTMQIDLIAIIDGVVIVIECKHLSDNVFQQVKGGAAAQKWVLVRKKGTKGPGNMYNAARQNYTHAEYINALLKAKGFGKRTIHVEQMVVFGGIAQEKINVTADDESNVIHENNLIGRIRYLLQENSKLAKANSEDIYDCICRQAYNDDNRLMRHLTFIRRLTRKPRQKKKAKKK